MKFENPTLKSSAELAQSEEATELEKKFEEKLNSGTTESKDTDEPLAKEKKARNEAITKLREDMGLPLSPDGNTNADRQEYLEEQVERDIDGLKARLKNIMYVWRHNNPEKIPEFSFFFKDLNPNNKFKPAYLARFEGMLGEEYNSILSTIDRDVTGSTSENRPSSMSDEHERRRKAGWENEFVQDHEGHFGKKARP